jgi:hypothetical protein
MRMGAMWCSEIDRTGMLSMKIEADRVHIEARPQIVFFP